MVGRDGHEQKIIREWRDDANSKRKRNIEEHFCERLAAENQITQFQVIASRFYLADWLLAVYGAGGGGSDYIDAPTLMGLSGGRTSAIDRRVALSKVIGSRQMMSLDNTVGSNNATKDTTTLANMLDRVGNFYDGLDVRREIA